MGGTRCTVAACKNTRVKTKMEPSTQHIKYHSFPKDKAIKNIWVSRCKRKGIWNPDSCHVCSIHFKEDDYERDLQAELLNLPPKRILKKTAVPSLHLGYTLAKEVDEASINRARRMERRCRQHLVRQLLESESYSNSSDKKSTSDKLTSAKDKEELVPATGSSDLTEEVNLWKKKCEELEKQISSERRVTEFWITRRRILENTVNQKQRAINNINKELRAIKRKASPKKMCECVQTILRKVFTESQCRILLYDKKKLEWDNESMAIAFRLRYLSKRAYLYLSKTLNYPLPSLSSLRRWAASVNGRQGILSEPLNVMKTTVHAKSCPQVGVYTYKLVVG